MALLLAIAAGLSLGAVLERGDYCFHSLWRGFTRRPRQLDLFRAYVLTLLIAVPLVQGLIALGWIEPWIPPFAWQANIVGGLIFGVGMVVGATCITGLFYKLGHGMVGVIVGLLFWAVGDMLVYLGPLRPLRDALHANPISINGASATVTNFFGPAGYVILALLAAAGIYYLWRSPLNGRGKLWNWLWLGLAAGLVTALAWLLARGGGSDYTYGTSGVPSGLVEGIFGGGSLGFWIPVTLICIIPGSFLAAQYAGTFWLRGETGRRLFELGAGGLIMGIGAGIAGGCNLGHSLVGVPLLSLGSITSTLAMAAGVFLAAGLAALWSGQRQLSSGSASA